MYCIMDFIKKHNDSNELKEYITCVKGYTSDTWTCIEGAYEIYSYTDINYDYKLIHTYKVPKIIKPVIFKMLHPNHILIIDYIHLK